MIYLDTSAAAKALILEDGSTAVRELFATGVGLVSSRLMSVELYAIADRRGLARSSVAEIVERVALVALTDDIAARAIDLRSGLRTLDALHLATAIDVGDAVSGFACFDAELARAAERNGIPPLVLADDAAARGGRS